MNFVVAKILLLLSFTIGAEESQKKAGVAPRKVNLDQALEMAMKSHLELLADKAGVFVAEAELDILKSEFSPKVEGVIGVGPATRANGNALQSVQDNSEFGFGFIGKINMTWPIYTWGRQKDYLNAIKLGAKAKNFEVELKKLDVIYRVKEAFYGILLAKTLEDLVDGNLNQLDEIIEKLEPGRKNKTLKLQLEMNLYQLRSKKAEVRSAVDIAKGGFAFLLTGKHDSSVEPNQSWLEYNDRELKTLEYYLAEFKKYHPQIKRVDAGIEAKSLLAEAENKAKYPALGVLAEYNWGRTNMRPDQDSVFAYDPFNRSELTAGIGLRWDYQWNLANSKSKKHLAEKAELVAKKSLAEKGLSAKVAKAWREVKKSEEMLKADLKANKKAKKWLSRVAIKAGTGLGDAKKLTDPLLARALALKNYYDSIYRYEMAWAELKRSVGHVKFTN